MRIGLFIPCFIDAFFPEVGIATLALLERFGHDVVYPRDQTCCGQPMADNGFNAEAVDTEAHFVRNFSGFDYIVAPEGSCVRFCLLRPTTFTSSPLSEWPFTPPMRSERPTKCSLRPPTPWPTR